MLVTAVMFRIESTELPVRDFKLSDPERLVDGNGSLRHLVRLTCAPHDKTARRHFDHSKLYARSYFDRHLEIAKCNLEILRFAPSHIRFCFRIIKRPAFKSRIAYVYHWPVWFFVSYSGWQFGQPFHIVRRCAEHFTIEFTKPAAVFCPIVS